MYGISADELHEMIIDDLKDLCIHESVSAEMIARIFTDNDGERGRPLHQTIRLVLTAIRYKD